MTESFGKRIRDRRMSLNMTIRELINRMGNCFSPAYMSKIEIHAELPSAEGVRKLCLALDLDQQEMLDLIRKEKFVKEGKRIAEKYGIKLGD